MNGKLRFRANVRLSPSEPICLKSTARPLRRPSITALLPLNASHQLELGAPFGEGILADERTELAAKTHDVFRARRLERVLLSAGWLPDGLAVQPDTSVGSCH